MADFQPTKLEQILSFYIENEFSVLEAARKIEELYNPVVKFEGTGKLYHLAKDGKITEIGESGIEGAYNDIMEFSKTFKAHIEEKPTADILAKVRDLRFGLIQEEVEETYEGMRDGNLEQIADGIADSIVVLIGTAIAYGIPLPAVWREVHRSNMAKANPDGSVTYREDGKVLKPEGWTPPDIQGIIKDASMR